MSFWLHKKVAQILKSETLKGPHSIMEGRSDVVKDADRVSRVLPAESTNKGLPANACTLPTSYVPP